MATKGKLTPYDDIQTRQVSSNMSEGLLGSSAARQQMASAKNLGEAGFEIADKIAAYGRKRQQQKDIEGSLKKLELLNRQYDLIFKEEKENWQPDDTAFTAGDDDYSLTRRVQDRMNEADAKFLETHTFTQGERDIFNIAQGRARIALGSRAFAEEKAQDTVRRTLEFDNLAESAATRAFEAENTKTGLGIYKEILDILNSDPEAYSQKTFEKLKGKLSNVAYSTALGLMTKHPQQLITDIDEELYNGILKEKEILTLRDQAGAELRRKDSGTDTQNRHAAVGQIAQVLRGELRADAVNTIHWHNKDNKILHEKKLIAAQVVADTLQGMGTISRSAFMDKVAAFEKIKKSSDDISRGFYEQFTKFLSDAIKGFDTAMKEDPIGAMFQYNPGLFEQLSDMNPYDSGYLEAVTNWQKDQGILSANIRLISNDELDQIANDLALTKKNINVTDLQNHTSIDQIRKTFENVYKKYGTPNYSRVTAELQLYSKKYNISEAEIIASAYINKPDLFALMIKTSMMTEQDWDALAKSSGLDDALFLTLPDEIVKRPRISKFLIQFGQFQRPARVAQMMQDVGRALAYLHKTTTGIPEKVEHMFLDGLGSYSLQTQGGDTHEIFFSNKITMKEGWVFEQNMVDPNWFFKQGAMLKIPNMTPQLTAAFYANMAYPCPTTGGDGKYNLCVFDKEAAGQPQRRLLNRSGELISVDEKAFFKRMDPTESRQDQRVKQLGKRNSGNFTAGFENALKAVVFLNRWSAEKQREFIDNAIGPGVDLSLENAHKLLPMTEVSPDAKIKPFGLDLDYIDRQSTPASKETMQKRIQEREAFYVKKRDMAISWSNQMRKLDYSKNVKPETMNQYENKINDLVNFADISQTIDSNKRRHIDKLLSEIRTSIHTNNDRFVKRGINKIALEIKFLFGQSVTDGDLTTPLTAMRTQIIDGRLVKNPNDLKFQMDPETMIVDGEETEIEVEDKSLTYEQAVAKLEEIHGKEDTEYLIKQNIQSLKESGEEYTDMEGVTYKEGEVVKKLVPKEYPPPKPQMSKKKFDKLTELENKQKEYVRFSGKKKSQFGAGSKKPEELTKKQKVMLEDLKKELKTKGYDQLKKELEAEAEAPNYNAMIKGAEKAVVQFRNDVKTGDIIPASSSSADFIDLTLIDLKKAAQAKDKVKFLKLWDKFLKEIEGK